MLTWIVFGADLAIRLALSVHVIMRRAPVQTSLAWLVLILCVPLLGLPAYLLVGDIRLGRWRLRRYQRVAADLESRAAVFWRGGEQDWTGDMAPYRHIARLGTVISRMPPLRGNQLRFLAECDEMIASLVRDIDAAKTRVDMLFYIWMECGAGERVADAVINAARRGVECRVLVDAVGSKPFLRSPLPGRMRAAGVKVVAALPANPLRMLFARVDLRNHRKIAVIDGWVAYVGSQNITDATFGLNPRRGIGPWIDATVRIEGPAAQALDVVFLRDWALDCQEDVGDPERLFPAHPIPEGGSVVQVVATGPSSPAETAAMRDAMLTTIYAAREELFITTPYFVPDDATRWALLSAALRGVDVTIVLPRHIDARLVAAACRSHYEDLLAAGVRIKEYRKGLLHAKTVTVDRDLALVSTANVDMRSFWLNFEVTVFIYDTDVASHLRMLQVEYMNDSDDVELLEWRRRPLWRRAVENTVRLMSPLL